MRLNKTSRVAIVILQALLLVTSPILGETRAQKPESVRLLTQPEVKVLPVQRKRWALIIGVDNYDKDISPLRGSVNDAKALKDVLITHAGFPVSQVILMTTEASDDLRPTRGNILDALERLSRQIPEGGLLLFSFSGHGTSIDNDAFLIPADGKVYQNAELMRERSIDVLRVKRAIQFTKARQVLMFLDACRNEPVRGKGDDANPMTKAYEGISGFDSRNKDIEAFATIFATSLGDRAFEFFDRQHQKYRGFFSYAIEEALRGEAANENGEITLGSLINYLERTVSQRVHIEKNQRQVPYPMTEGYRSSQLVLAVVRDLNISIGDKKAPDFGSTTTPADNAREAFLGIQNSSVVSHIRAVLEEFPTSRYAPDLRKRLERLVWESAKASQDKVKLQAYLDEFGDKAQFASLARIEIRKVTASAAIPPAPNAANPAGNAVSLANQALTEIINGNDEAAKRLADKALELDKRLALALGIRGWAKQELNLGGSFLPSSELARKDLEAAVKLDPRNALFHARLISVYSRLHKNRLANKAAKDVLSLVVSPITPVDYFARGIAQHATNHFAEALSDFAKAIELNPSFAHAFYYRGLVHHQTGKYDLAIADFTKAIESAPRSAYVYRYRGVAYADNKNDQSAFRDYTKAIELDPRYVDAYRSRGLAYYHQKDYPTAIRDFTNAIAIDPLDASLYRDRGDVYYDQKDYQAAIGDYDKAIKLNPGYAGAYYSRGYYFWYYQKDYPAAIRDYTKAVQLDPQFAHAYIGRGDIHYSQKDYPAAVRDYTKAVELDPQLAEAYEARGDVLNSQKDYPAAIRDLTKAIELNPQFADAYDARGDAYFNQKDYQGAIGNYTKAIELGLERVNTFRNRADAYRNIEDYSSAISDYTKTIELGRKDPILYSARGLCYYHLNDYPSAIKDHTKAIELSTKPALHYYNRGLAYYYQGDNQAAIRDQTKALELNPRYAKAYMMRARAYEEIGRNDLAQADRQMYEKLK